MQLRSELRKLLSYLVGKKSEFEHLDVKDIVMAKVILDIHRKRTHKELAVLPLFSIHQIHVLDRENALRATEKRVETLIAHKPELLQARTLSCDLLGEYLPSVSWIKVVEERPGSYLAFEGNGRLAAMQRVFQAEDDMQIEVQRYHFRNPRTIVRRLNRVRRLNGLL
jgi:hypothetical protein